MHCSGSCVGFSALGAPSDNKPHSLVAMFTVSPDMASIPGRTTSAGFGFVARCTVKLAKACLDRAGLLQH
jgi:hypothetical protein